MSIPGVGGSSNLPSSASVTLYQLDAEIDQLQILAGKGQEGSSAYQAASRQLLQDSTAWVQKGTNSQQFPQFTSWVADAQMNGNNMNPNNPFATILTGESQGGNDLASALSTLAAVLGGSGS